MAITRSTVGIQLRDPFTRVDSASVGGGWDESIAGDGTLAIVSNEVEKPIGGAGTFGVAYRDGGTQEALLANAMVQINARFSGTFNMFLEIRTDIKDVGAGFEDRYVQSLNRSSSQHRFDRVINGAVTDSVIRAFAPANVSRGVRIITEVSGSNLIIRGKITNPLASKQDLTEKFDADSGGWQFTDTSPIPLSGNTLDYFFLMQNGLGEADEFISSGREVTVNDVPSGWKVVIDGGTPVVSTGVPVVIDFDEEPNAFALLEITDDLDVLQASFSPTSPLGGGGDVYESGLVPGPFDARSSTAAVPAAVTAGDTVNITVTGRDAVGVPVTVGGATVEITVEGLSIQTPLELVVTDVGDGTYTASYVTTEQDTQTVTIKAAASPLQNISGSPFTVAVAPPGEAIVFGSGSANPAWKDRALLGFFIGRPDQTDIQEILGSLVGPPGQVFVTDNTLYVIGEELALFRDVAGKDLPFLEDPDEVFTETDRIPIVINEPDVPPGRNIAPNPGLSEFAGGQPDDVLTLGTVILTQKSVTLFPEFVEIGGSSLFVDAQTAEAGVQSINVAIAPDPGTPYFAAWAKVWIQVGAIRFELVHSVLGVIPAADSNARAIVTALNSWQTVYIVPGENLPFVAGDLALRIVAEGSPAQFFLDAWSLSNTPFALPWIGQNPGNLLYDRAVQKFLNEGVDTPKLRYTVNVLDLSESVFPEDNIRLGNTIVVRDRNLGVDTTERIVRVSRDHIEPELVAVELAERRLALTAPLLQRLARLEPVRRLELVPILILFLPFFDEFGELIIQYSGNHRTQSVRFVVSTDTAPTRAQVEVGNINAGRADDRVSTGLFTDTDVFVGMIPFSEPAGVGTAGPLYAWTGRNNAGVGNSPRLDNVIVVIVQADGDVTVTFSSADAGTLSTRHAFNVAVSPVFPTSAAVEAGTIRNFAFPGSDVFSLGVATVPQGETIRLSAAPYTLVGGVGAGGATDHGTIVSGEDQRDAQDAKILTFVSAEVTPGSGPGCASPWIEKLSWTLEDAPDVDFDVQLFRALSPGGLQFEPFQLVTTIADPNTTTFFDDDPTGSFKEVSVDVFVQVRWRLDLRNTTGPPVVVHQAFVDQSGPSIVNVNFACFNA